MTTVQLGYVGLGIMGSSMAANLLRAGFGVSVWNRTASRAADLMEQGALRKTSAREVAAASDIVFINVTDTPDVEAVLFGEDGIARGIRPGSIVVDHSTISPESTRSFADKLAKQGVTLLDAPVTGGDVGAKNATLSIMVGGDRHAFDRVLPVLEKVGKTITHVGVSGMGQLCKLCNQVAVFANLAGACEAIQLARACGLDPATMLKVVGAGAGASWQLINVGPKALSGDFAPGFTLDLSLKDLGLVAQAFEAAGIDHETVKAAVLYMSRVRNESGGKLATPAMIQGVISGRHQAPN